MEKNSKLASIKNTVVSGVFVFFAGGLCGYSLSEYQNALEKEAQIKAAQAKAEAEAQKRSERPGIFARMLNNRYGSGE